MIMKTLLVESNDQICQQLQSILSYFQSVQVVERVKTVEQAIAYLHGHPVDLVISNMQPAPAQTSGDGCHMISILAEFYPDVQTVLYLEDIKDMNRLTLVSGAGFVLYPFDLFAFQRVMKRVSYVFELQQYKKMATDRHILVKTKDGYQRLAVDQILFIERSNRRNMIVTTDGRSIYLYRYTMEELESMLEPSGFYRCYQSFIVNLSKVESVYADCEKKNYTIRFRDYSGDILLSRDKYSELVSILAQRFSNVSL